MSVAELKHYILKSKYARYNQEAMRRETYDEAVNRVREMMHVKYPMPEATRIIDWAYDQVLKEVALGSQRAMQYGGEPVLRKNARMYNCTSSYADRLRFFQEAFWMLLCGCGVGFSVQRHHVARLPAFAGPEADRVAAGRGSDAADRRVFVVPDTIEGWADSIGVLLSAYFPGGPFPEYFGKYVEFDFGLIRPKGSPLSSGAGRAPGPEPLIQSLIDVRSLLDRCIASGRRRLRPIDAYDIVMHASEAVLAGGVRRSASICIFSPDDDEMANAKTGDWLSANPQRRRSNNSALMLRHATDFDSFDALMRKTREWGEPGFAWADSTEWLPNACTEIGFWPAMLLDRTDPRTLDLLRDYQGPIGLDGSSLVGVGDDSIIVSGWQHCNLSTINGGRVDGESDFYLGCVVASVVGTLQAGFNDFEYLGRVSEEIVRKEALLGVSITSIMSNPKVMLDPAVLRRGAGIVLATNKSVARLIGINPCARGTCIKPEGTSTLMLGSLASGCHGWPFARGIRHVQANRDEVVYQWFRAFNPEACQPSRWARGGTDDVIAFPVEAPPGARLQGDMTAVEFLDVVKTLYLNWVVPGKRPERCTQPWLHHSVSNTVKVKDHEWEGVTRHIYDNRWCYAGISLLSWTGDKDYEQAPNVAVYTRDEMAAMYGEVAVSLVPCTYQRVLDAYDGDLWQACRDLESGVIPGDSERAMAYGVADWFCVNHMRGDRRQMCYLLKDLYYADAYDNLRRTFSPVPYEHLIEEEDATTPLAEPSCVGGACALA